MIEKLLLDHFFLFLDHLRDFNFPHPYSLRTGSSWQIKGYTDEDFWKVFPFFQYKLLKSLQQVVINPMEKMVLLISFGDTFRKLI